MSIVLTVILAVIVGLSNIMCDCHIPILVPTSNYSLLNNCACQIASSSSARVTFIYSEQTDEDLIRCVSNLPLPVVTLITASGDESRNFSSMHILTFGEDVPTRFTQVARMLKPQTRYKHLSKYVLIFQVPCDAYLDRFFKLLWTNGILNVIALCGKLEIFTYEPFTSDGFKIVRIPTTTESSLLFYDKLRNLHHFQLRISQFHNPIKSIPLANNTAFRGIDGLVAMTMVERLNATVCFVVPRSDELYGYDKNGTLTGALKAVSTGDTHVSFNSRFINLNHVEMLQPVGRQSLVYLVVPKAAIAPQYLNFIRVFDPLTWGILLVNFFLVGLIFAAMQQVVLQLTVTTDSVQFGTRDIVEMLFKTAIGDPVDGFHRISSLREFLMAWILFSYVISSIYFAKMESVFVHPEYQQDIDRLSEVSRLSVPIYVNPNLLDVTKSSLDTSVWDVIVSKVHPLPEDYEAPVYKLIKMSNKNAFILRQDRAYILIARTYNDDNKMPTYHLVREYLMSFSYTYIVTRGSPFVDKFQTLHSWFFEHGFLDYFESAELYKENIRNDKSTDDEVESEDSTAGSKRKKRAVVLDMGILQGSFYMWAIGIAVGCLGFIVELGYWKWHAKESSTNSVACEDEEIEIGE